mmetsp:Transcript_15028/g.42755  ORF Transcript_15028/g.42755 Transcript_15028/m.42755 type:complete len:269 (+) Transcript_15028:763-1569(+)
MSGGFLRRGPRRPGGSGSRGRRSRRLRRRWSNGAADLNHPPPMRPGSRRRPHGDSGCRDSPRRPRSNTPTCRVALRPHESRGDSRRWGWRLPKAGAQWPGTGGGRRRWRRPLRQRMSGDRQVAPRRQTHQRLCGSDCPGWTSTAARSGDSGCPCRPPPKSRGGLRGRSRAPRRRRLSNGGSGCHGRPPRRRRRRRSGPGRGLPWAPRGGQPFWYQSRPSGGSSSPAAFSSRPRLCPGSRISRGGAPRRSPAHPRDACPGLGTTCSESC